MKKILASCLTTLALLGSVCFSSPPAQVHANETSTEQSSSTIPIDLNVDEKIKEHQHHILDTKLKPGDIIIINNLNNIGKYSGKGTNVDYIGGYTFKVIKNPNHYSEYVILQLKTTTENKDYLIYTTLEESDEENNDNAKEIEIDLSRTPGETYNAPIGKPGSTEKTANTPVTVEPIMYLNVNKTTNTLLPGSSFELKLPEKIATDFGEKYKLTNYINTIKDLKINGVAIDDDKYSDYIKEIDPQNPWKISLLPTIKAKDTVSFKACIVKKESPAPKSVRSENALVTYQAELPEEEKYPKMFSPNEQEYPFPVELTIVDEGKDNPIDDGDKKDPIDNGDKDENINNKEDEIKDEINSEKEPSSGKDETQIDEEESSDKESNSTAFKTGDNNSAVIFAAFAMIISGMLMIILCVKKTIKK